VVVTAGVVVVPDDRCGAPHYLILDTKANLVLHNTGMEGEPTVLPKSEGQTYHYRYRNLR
jgi:hypothetical protein